MNEDFLRRKLRQRQENFNLRELRIIRNAADFCSNDYLGIVRDQLIDVQNEHSSEKWSGSTGSRLISGNYPLIEETEQLIARFHESPAALIFNSGYDANLGLLGSVPQRNDTVLYDQLSHASIRDGIRLSHAYSFSFAHNDPDDLEKKLQSATGTVFVVTESVFSMDGDIAPLDQIASLCESYGALLIVDEAHATGVMGASGEGVVQQTGLTSKCFARVHTFGKALGCHGAAVLGSDTLKQYLVNFCRPFIYTTGMPASSVAAIKRSYEIFPSMSEQRDHLHHLTRLFHDLKGDLRLCNSVTPIQGVIIPGNERVKEASARLIAAGLDVRPILYPTVAKGLERLRVVLHSFNTAGEVTKLTDILKELH